MTEFGDELKKELEAWNSADMFDEEGKRLPKTKKEKVIKYQCDVSGCDMTIVRNLNGKDTSKLFIYLSQTEDGHAIAFIKKMKEGTREALTESNLRNFFDGLSSYYREVLETGSEVIPEIRREKKFLTLLLDVIKDTRFIELAKKGMVNTELLWNYKLNDYRNSLPWFMMNEDSYSYDKNNYPTKIHMMLWDHMISYISESQGYKRSEVLEKIFGDDCNDKSKDAVIFEYIADIFDDFFAIKCFDEYMDNTRMSRLSHSNYSYHNSYEQIVKLFTVKITDPTDPHHRRYDGGYYGESYSWRDAVNDMKEQVPFFVRFEKKRFWEYLQHAVCLGLGSNLNEYITTWRDYLVAAYRCDGKIKDKYPEHLQEMHDVYSEKARIVREFMESEKLMKVTEIPAELCDMEHDGMCLKTLRTVGDYTTEAQQNANCVATYVQHTLGGKSWVCSFRSAKSDTTLLTVEVNDMGEMCQIKGKYNRAPSQKELAQLSWFQKKIFEKMEKKEMPVGKMPYEISDAVSIEKATATE